MTWDREEFREQMRACRNCGRLCDGDVCDASCANELDERENAHAFEPDEDDETSCVHCGGKDQDHEN